MEMLATLLPIILIFAVFYFLIIRPQQKQQKAVRQMQQEMKKGDKVITIGGLHGVVDAIDENKVVIKAGDHTLLTFDRRAVREVSAE
ncbi:preprotein translocase subunit YajC [Bacillus sp. WMMC1349]|uniref:preprotein translocase subunit YajC n=1 Tax=Bacillus sp. WMMC1349 TaxID=2736254 RepID=UPI001557BB56|nr:preprotein translocase subunit YajC [Bacillus sp. WMMC1349]NPC93513.1 preprotein translocase subunit YajC [Bacillus sp. WMMC1349]